MKADQFIINEAGEMPTYYFAYGMLTDPKKMPNAKLVGVAELRNFEYRIYKYANVEAKTGVTTYGCLWEIDRKTLQELDRVEGYPSLYDRRNYPVYHNGKKYEAEVYMMTPETLSYLEDTIPSRRYVESVARGYMNAGIPIDQLRKALTNTRKKNKNIDEGNDKEFYTGGGLGMPFPGTYEEEYNMFKTKGPRRITAMTYETENDKTTTLNKLYHGNKPDRDEVIWNYVGTRDFDIPFTIETINPMKLSIYLTSQYRVEDIRELYDMMTRQQRQLIKNYAKDPNLSNEVIVMSNGHILDGNHRAVAAVLTKKPIKYIDVSEEVLT